MQLFVACMIHRDTR